MNNTEETKVMKLKRVVIKEEMVAITGDFISALILNQLLYWSERVRDFDAFIAEENRRREQSNTDQIPLSRGWIYKSASQLSDELMVSLSAHTIGRHISTLVSLGLVSERHNPNYRWDRTKQYRVNLLSVSQAMKEKGYELQGYRWDKEIANAFSTMENQTIENGEAITKTTSETSNLTTTTTDSQISKLFDENIQRLTPYLERRLLNLIEKYSAEWVLDAVKEAINFNHTNLAYISKILETWEINGGKTAKPSKRNADILRKSEVVPGENMPVMDCSSTESSANMISEDSDVTGG